MLSTSLLVVVLACSPSAPALSAADAQELEWSEVLQIAASHAPDAKARLAELRNKAAYRQVKTLVTEILFLWNDRLGTYEAREPRAVEQECLPGAEVKRILGNSGEMVRLDLEVRVSRDGRPVSVKLLRTTHPKAALRAAVEKSLMRTKFVPRRIHDRYEEGLARVECKVEVR